MPTTRPTEVPPLSEASARLLLEQRGIIRGPDDYRTAARVLLDLEAGVTPGPRLPVVDPEAAKATLAY